MADREAHPLNAPGDFYVENGCCTLCGIPWTEAPDLFALVGDDHCYVARQPNTPAELDQMVGVIECAELECIRYRGHDTEIQSRLVELGEGEQCDNLASHLAARSDAVRARLASARSAGPLRESPAQLNWWQRISQWLKRRR